METDPEIIEFFNNFAFDEVVNNDDLDDHTRVISILDNLIGCQWIAYLRIGRVFPFLNISNEVLKEKDIKFSLEKQGSGKFFRKEMRDFYKSEPEETRHTNLWLAANCFGDYYTRNNLDYKQHKLITFYFLFSQWGCESQLKANIGANIKIGNDKNFLIKVISQCLPYNRIS